MLKISKNWNRNLRAVASKKRLIEWIAFIIEEYGKGPYSSTEAVANKLKKKFNKNCRRKINIVVEK